MAVNKDAGDTRTWSFDMEDGVDPEQVYGVSGEHPDGEWPYKIPPIIAGKACMAIVAYIVDLADYYCRVYKYGTENYHNMGNRHQLPGFHFFRCDHTGISTGGNPESWVAECAAGSHGGSPLAFEYYGVRLP